MKTDHIVPEAQAAELRRAIRAALEAERQAGYAQASYIHDRLTHETLLYRRRDAAVKAASDAEAAVWAAYFEIHA